MNQQPRSISNEARVQLQSALADLCDELLTGDVSTLAGITQEFLGIITTAADMTIKARAPAANKLNAFSKLPPELVCAAFQHLALDELMAATHVCQHWRQILVGSSALWSRISGNPGGDFLALLLDRSQDAPVDILELRAVNEEDSLLNVVLPHMHHIRTFALRFSYQKTAITSGSPAYKVLTSQAPMLEQLSILSNPFARAALPLDTIDYPFSGVAPLLKTIQLMAISRMPPFFASLPELGRSRIHTLTIGGFRCALSYQRVESIISFVPSLRILNLELREWTDNPELGDRQVIPSTLQELNIRATHPRGFFPQEMLPEGSGWDGVARVHMACEFAREAENLDRPAFLPRNGAPIIELEFRDQADTDFMHVRTTHADGCVRTYSGIDSRRAAALLDDKAAASIETLIVSAAISTATMAKVEVFATALEQVVRLGALQRIEHMPLQQWDPPWDSGSINRPLSNAFKYGDDVPEVHLVGLQSDGSPQRERESDGIETEPVWFMKPPFEWK